MVSLRKPSEEVKHLLRKIGARGKKSLVEAMGRALGAVSIEDVRGFFAHCGYRTPARPTIKTLLVLNPAFLMRRVAVLR